MARGCCASTGLVFATLALILALIANVSQINGTLVPRHLSLITLETDGFLDALSAANDLGVTNLTDVYAATSKNTATRQPNHDGLRKSYSWGLWSYCAGSTQDSPDYCTPRAFGASFAPATQLLADLPAKYADEFTKTIPKSIFTDNGYLEDFTRAASLVGFVGSAAIGLAWVFALPPWRFFVVLSALLQLLGTAALAVASVIYTIIVYKVQDALAGVKIEGVAVGLALSIGTGLYLLWAATGVSLLSLMALTFSCCCGRSNNKEDKVKSDKKRGKARQMEKNYNSLGHY